MDYWDFLIQQEGDQTWLPLETKQVEILEGRYRLAAHTSRIHTPVEIRVTHLLLDEMPPRRRVRKRKGLTNDAGLVIIFPFMQLKPGRWAVRCSGDDVMSEMLGSGWQYGVQLQVLPRVEEDWDPDWSSAVIENDDRPPLVESSEAAGEGSFSPPQPVEDRIPAGTTMAVARSQLSVTVALDSDYHLQLAQQAYVSPVGHPLTLSGQILRSLGDYLVESELSVQLRDPQTAQVLFDTRLYLTGQSIPATFDLELPLPSSPETQVIVGVVALRDKAVPPDQPVLASSAFTITIGLDQLLDAIANQEIPTFEEETSIYPGTTEPFLPPSESFSTLISPDFPLETHPIRGLVPSLGSTLPPQLNESAAATKATEPTKPSERPPELPTLPTKSPAAASLPTLDESLPVPAIFESDNVEEDDLAADLAAAALAEDPEAFDTLLPESAEQTETVTSTEEDPLVYQQLDQAFQSLNLQERFWTRLTALTFEGHRAATELKEAIQAAGVRETGSAPPPSATEAATVPTQEVVIYEEAPDLAPPLSHPVGKPLLESDVIEITPPILEVPNHELMAGELVAVRVQLPQTLDYRPYVKIWMNDLQTRSVIDEPRLLMQFTPNQLGNWETLIRMKIPLGCLQLQFAAIAIDMSTLQESARTVINRSVIPPDLPPASLDEFDL